MTGDHPHHGNSRQQTCLSMLLLTGLSNRQAIHALSQNPHQKDTALPTSTRGQESSTIGDGRWNCGLWYSATEASARQVLTRGACSPIHVIQLCIWVWLGTPRASCEKGASDQMSALKLI
eukprot:2147051-Amphidinium_carterae.1